MATSNPLIQQGYLNKLAASITVPNFPNLNITAGYLGKKQISLALVGQSTTFIDTQVGAVISPEPYVKATVRAALLKTQPLAAYWKLQMETQAAIGPITVTTDSTSFPYYNFLNCAIETVDGLTFSGTDADYMVVVTGYYPQNASMWNLI